MSSPLSDYCVVEGKSPAELSAAVKSRIAKGWEVVGGVAVVPNRPKIGSIHCTFFQAMTYRVPLLPPPPK